MSTGESVQLAHAKLNRLAHPRLDSFSYREQVIRTLLPVLDVGYARLGGQIAVAIEDASDDFQTR
jgi:hypothetical protein